MRSEKAMTSRREFVSNALGIALNGLDLASPSFRARQFLSKFARNVPRDFALQRNQIGLSPIVLLAPRSRFQFRHSPARG